MITNYDVVKKLIGSSIPYGDSRLDEDVLENLTQKQILVEHLINDIKETASFIERSEHSINQIALSAQMFLEELKNNLINEQ